MEKNNNLKSCFLGLGLDGKDGHIRITHGKNFHLFGGSEPTHNLMQEKIIKFNQQLDKRGKKLDDISEDEFCEIADKVGLPFNDPDRN